MADYGEGLWTYLFNTAAVSLMTVAGTLFVSALGGYAFARFRFPGKNLLFLRDARDPDGPVRDDPDPAVRACSGTSGCRTRWSASASC